MDGACSKLRRLDDDGSSGSANKRHHSTMVSLRNSDWELLQNIFPEEIWLEVLGKIGWSSKELAIHASPYFSHLLHPMRSQFLFPSAWKVLGIRYELDPSYLLKTDNKMLWRRKILSLRLVCKDWSSGVEDFYESRYPLFSLTNGVFQARVETDLDSEDEFKKNISHTSELGEWTDYMFVDTTDTNYFLGHFGETHGPNVNPFLGRSVVLDGARICCHRSVLQANCLITDFTKLITKYGTHIWFCTIDFLNVYQSPIAYFGEILNWLSLMPNLKVIKFDLGANNYNLTDYQKRYYFQIQEITRMKNLQFASFHNTAGAFINKFLEENWHVTKLELGNGDKINLNEIYLPNLKHLSYIACSLEEWRLLENCQQPWNLETLCIIVVVQEFPDVHVEWLFHFLEKWQNTLTDVAVVLPNAISAEVKNSLFAENKLRLNLPKVKRFRIEIPNIPAVDFLLPMKSLEVLEVAVEWDEEASQKEIRRQVEEPEIIKFSVKWDRAMYKSNIWELFPKLKRIHTKFSLGQSWLLCGSYVRRKYKQDSFL